jgi:hypothetical protein
MLLFALFLGTAVPAHAQSDNSVTQSGGGGYTTLQAIGLAHGNNSWWGYDWQVESWFSGYPVYNCSNGSLVNGTCQNRCSQSWYGETFCYATANKAIAWNYGCFTTWGRFYYIHNGISTYDETLSTNRCYDPPTHHDPIKCPDDGPYYCGSSPILIPLTPGALKLSAPEVAFDINGDGVLETLSWPEDTDRIAFLAADFNGNGTIDNGRELFGNFTRGTFSGFTALADIAFKEDGEPPFGELNKSNKLFAKLLLWNDRNRNGVSEPSELQPASNVLLAVGLGYEQTGKKDPDGNEYRFKGWARYLDRSERPIYDVFLAKQ